jgi:uncharacterized protein (TIGR03435 family)
MAPTLIRAVLALFLCGAGLAQLPDAHPAFAVASVKKSLRPDPKQGMMIGATGGPGTNDPGLFSCKNFDIGGLVAMAYAIEHFQLSGPDWIGDERFDVMAKVPEGATSEQFRLMLQDLLKERFRLAVHTEKKEMPVYELKVGKNGPKVKDSVGPPMGQPPSEVPSDRTVDGNGFPILPPGRYPWWTSNSNRSRRRVANMSMEEFAHDLSFLLMSPVIDSTGLKGRYDFTLSWMTESSGPAVAADDAGPTLFGAIQEQLGLRLDQKKGLADMLVIDHIEKTPTEN